MYCSEECKKQAYYECHRYECEVIDLLRKSHQTVHQALTAFFKGLVACNDSIDELQTLVAKHMKGERRSNVFDFDFTRMSDKEAAKANLQILVSGAKAELQPEEMIFFRNCFITILNAHSFPIEVAQERFVEEFLMNVLRVFLVNVYAISKPSSEAASGSFKIGSGYSSFSSLLSHSCAPSIQAVNVSDKLLGVAILPIKKGEQLTWCYG